MSCICISEWTQSTSLGSCLASPQQSIKNCKQSTWCKLWSALALHHVLSLVWSGGWACPVGGSGYQLYFVKIIPREFWDCLGLQLSRCWMESRGSSCFSFGSNMEMLSASLDLTVRIWGSGQDCGGVHWGLCTVVMQDKQGWVWKNVVSFQEFWQRSTNSNGHFNILLELIFCVKT